MSVDSSFLTELLLTRNVLLRLLQCLWFRVWWLALARPPLPSTGCSCTECLSPSFSILLVSVSLDLKWVSCRQRIVNHGFLFIPPVSVFWLESLTHLRVKQLLIKRDLLLELCYLLSAWLGAFFPTHFLHHCVWLCFVLKHFRGSLISECCILSSGFGRTSSLKGSQWAGTCRSQRADCVLSE